MRIKSAMATVLGVTLAIGAPVSTHADPQGTFQRLTTSEVTIPAGTPLPVVVDTTVASNISRVEQPVRAHLSRDVRVDNRIVLPAGSDVYGHVTAVRRPGKVKGRSYIAVRFNTLVPRGSSERYTIDTGRISRTGRTTKKQDALKIGAPAAGGAAIGALVGGKKGALIGSGIGGGAGTAVVLSTRGEEVGIGRGAALTLRLAQPVAVRR
jgi:hypothetical protein